MAQQSAGDRVSAAADFGVQQVAELLGTTPARVRGWVRSGVVQPRRGARGEPRFSFRDLTFLRQLGALERARVPARRVRRALRRLRQCAEAEGTALGLSVRHGEVVLRRGERLWNAESGQGVFDFAPAEAAAPVREIGRQRGDDPAAAGRCAGDWVRLGADLEDAGDPEGAGDAYRRALDLDPRHADAAIQLGCLYHDQGRLEEAERHYRIAIAARPDATAFFDLGVVLEDRQRDAEARRAYEQALALDAACADAHCNLARLCERSGDRAGALRHWTAWRRLSG